MKKWILLSGLLLLFGMTSVVKAQGFFGGDVNGDGGVDFQDVRALVSSMTSVFDMSEVVLNFGKEVIGPTVTPKLTNPPSGGRLAPVAVSGNGKYLVKDNGEPFLWMADTAWFMTHRLKREEITRYLEKRKQQGFTVIMLSMALYDPNDVGGSSRYGQTPWINKNLATPNGKYFELVDYTLDEMERLDLTAGLLPMWGWVLGGKYGYKNSDAQVTVYANWLGNRYKNRGNIVWISGGDTGTDRRWKLLGEGVKVADSKKMVTMHPSVHETSTFHKYQDASWLDFHMTQTGHTWDKSTNYTTVNQVYNNSTKPILNGEPIYEEIFMGKEVSPGPGTPYQVRKAGYWSLFAGSFGRVYGHTSVWQFYQAAGQKATYGSKTKWENALVSQGGKEMSYSNQLLKSVQWHKYVPNQSLISSSNPSGAAHMRATMKSDKTAAMIYIPEKKAVTVKLSGLSGEIRARWFNPQTGVYSGAGSYPASGTKSFTPPFGPDSVLVLE